MKLSTMDLRLFAAIADSGGITAAARRLGLTKSLVSRELASMELRLGVRLVQRTTRRTSLTETGDLLALHARRVVAEMERAEAAIEATRDKPCGGLKVTASFSVLRFVLLPRLSAFRARYPGIRLALDASTSIVDLVAQGIDVAVRVGELPNSSLVARRLATVPVVLAASPSYLSKKDAPAEPSDLVAHEVIALARSLEGSIWTLSHSDGRTARCAVNPILAAHEPGIVLDAARQGLGIAAVPSLYAAGEFGSGALKPILAGWTLGRTPIHAVYPSSRNLAPKVRAFVDFMAEILDPPAARDPERHPG